MRFFFSIRENKTKNAAHIMKNRHVHTCKANDLLEDLQSTITMATHPAVFPIPLKSNANRNCTRRKCTFKQWTRNERNKKFVAKLKAIQRSKISGMAARGNTKRKNICRHHTQYSNSVQLICLRTNLAILLYKILAIKRISYDAKVETD